MTVATDGHSITLGADGHYGVVVSDGYFDDAGNPRAGPLLVVLAAGGGFEVDLTDGEAFLRLPGPEIQWMGNPEPIAPLVRFQYHVLMPLDGYDDEVLPEFRLGAGAAQRIHRDPDGLTMLTAAPLFTAVLGPHPWSWSLGLQVGIDRLELSGLRPGGASMPAPTLSTAPPQ